MHKTRWVVLGLGALVLAIGGSIVGSAVAAQISTPDNIKDESATTVWETNESGVTYGSALKATSPSDEPALILVVATNGKEGYVYRDDLAVIEGTGFKSPDEALKWQNSMAGKIGSVSVYEVDGKTVIGEFVIQYSTEEELNDAIKTDVQWNQ